MRTWGSDFSVTLSNQESLHVYDLRSTQKPSLPQNVSFTRLLLTLIFFHENGWWLTFSGLLTHLKNLTKAKAPLTRKICMLPYLACNLNKFTQLLRSIYRPLLRTCVPPGYEPSLEEFSAWLKDYRLLKMKACLREITTEIFIHLFNKYLSTPK